MNSKRKLTQAIQFIASDSQLLAGVIGLVFLLLIAILAPLISPFDPYFLGPDITFAPGEGEPPARH